MFVFGSVTAQPLTPNMEQQSVSRSVLNSANMEHQQLLVECGSKCICQLESAPATLYSRRAWIPGLLSFHRLHLHKHGHQVILYSPKENTCIYIYKAKYSVSAAFTLALTVVCFRNGTVLQMIQMQMKRSKVLKDPR